MKTNKICRNQVIQELVDCGFDQFKDYSTHPISDIQKKVYDDHKEFEVDLIFSPDGVESYAVCSDGIVRIKTNKLKDLKTTKNFFGKTGKLEIDPENKNYYLIEFNSKNELYDFYDEVRELCYEKNFDLDPANWAAYGYFTYEGEKFYINSARQSNGDLNWCKYEDESKRFCEIYLV